MCKYDWLCISYAKCLHKRRSSNGIPSCYSLCLVNILTKIVSGLKYVQSLDRSID